MGIYLGHRTGIIANCCTRVGKIAAKTQKVSSKSKGLVSASVSGQLPYFKRVTLPFLLTGNPSAAGISLTLGGDTPASYQSSSVFTFKQSTVGTYLFNYLLPRNEKEAKRISLMYVAKGNRFHIPTK